MLAAAEDLRFEYAAKLRDELRELRRDLTRSTPPRLRGATARSRRRADDAGERQPHVRLRRVTSPRIAADIDRRRSSGATSRSAGAAMSRPPSTRTCARCASEIAQLQREAPPAAADPSLASTAGTQVQSILDAAEAAAAEIERRRARARARRATRPLATPRARASEAIAQARAHVGGRRAGDRHAARARRPMDAEVSALAREPARPAPAASRRTSRAVDADMGELYGAASGLPRHAPSRDAGSRRSPRRRPPSRRAVQRARAPTRAALRRARRRPHGASRAAGATAAQADAPPLGGTARRSTPDAQIDRARARRGQRRPRRRAAGRAEHGARRQAARGRRALPRRELHSSPTAAAARRGLRRVEG